MDRFQLLSTIFESIAPTTYSSIKLSAMSHKYARNLYCAILSCIKCVYDGNGYQAESLINTYILQKVNELLPEALSIAATGSSVQGIDYNILNYNQINETPNNTTDNKSNHNNVILTSSAVVFGNTGKKDRTFYKVNY